MAIKFTPVRYGVLCFLTGRCLMCCTALLSPASRRRPSTAKRARSQDVVTKLRLPISLTTSSKEIPDIDSSTVASKVQSDSRLQRFILSLAHSLLNETTIKNDVLIHFQMIVNYPSVYSMRSKCADLARPVAFFTRDMQGAFE